MALSVWDPRWESGPFTQTHLENKTDAKWMSITQFQRACPSFFFFFFDLSFAPLLLHQVPMTIIPECPLDSWEMYNSLNCPRKHNSCFSSQRNRTTVQFSNLSWKMYTYNLYDWFLGKVGTISITWGRSKYHNYLITSKQISILLWKSAFCVRLLS